MIQIAKPRVTHKSHAMCEKVRHERHLLECHDRKTKANVIK